ncbi:hypothetical protein OHA01_08920 [Micromonospora zamorensis]|uniref:hypothetical protein n=1 Tax=Micromonospora zamorensis TaxID=709883 RepID=UPI0038634609|nr:hypothetical protein OHA01_08920 [Micromonospora zamorensis]
MADEVDVLLQMWLNRWEQIRHSEVQRSVTSNMLLVLVGVGLGLIGQKGLGSQLLPVTLGILASGLFGMLLSVKYYERFRFHLSEAAALRAKLDERFPAIELESSRSYLNDDQARNFPLLIKIRLYWLWLAMHAVISLAGASLTVAILF